MLLLRLTAGHFRVKPSDPRFIQLEPIDWISHLGIIGSFLALCGYAGLMALLGIGNAPHLGICLWKAITGLPCPTCGLTRSLASAFRGEWSASLWFHPLSLAIFTISAWLAWMCARGLWQGRPVHLGRRAAWSLLLLGIACWVVQLIRAAPL